MNKSCFVGIAVNILLLILVVLFEGNCS